MMPDPLWYEFAGRPELKEKTLDDKGKVEYTYAAGLDFNVQPWDSTCEAEGRSPFTTFLIESKIFFFDRQV